VLRERRAVASVAVVVAVVTAVVMTVAVVVAVVMPRSIRVAAKTLVMVERRRRRRSSAVDRAVCVLRQRRSVGGVRARARVHCGDHCAHARLVLRVVRVVRVRRPVQQRDHCMRVNTPTHHRPVDRLSALRVAHARDLASLDGMKEVRLKLSLFS
jgi:hypothetical protein